MGRKRRRQEKRREKGTGEGEETSEVNGKGTFRAGIPGRIGKNKEYKE